MNLAAELKQVISQRVEAASPDEILNITSALCGTHTQHLAPAPFNPQMPAEERFTLIGPDGRQLCDGEGPHVATYDALYDLTWMADPVANGEEFNWQGAMKAASEVRLFGCTSWRAPTIQEQLSIIDYGRCDPAVDTRYFRGPHGWVWTSTEAAAPAAFAWFVDLVSGYSLRDHQSNHSLVRAVRAGQPFALGFSRPG